MSERIALVTGAGSGIGRAVAQALAADGFRVVLAGRRAAALATVAAGIGPRALVVPTDVTDAAAVEALYARIERDCGRLDLLFNNAGRNAPARPLEDLPLDEWRATIDTNLTGAYLCLRAAFRLMKSQRPQGGRIINNGSIAAQSPRPDMVAYTASKHAITGLTKAAALEGRRHGIACGQIDIGNTLTELSASFTQGVRQADDTLKPEPSFDVQHVADAVRYMARLPLDANVLCMTVMATNMPLVGRG
jgi:NAD(P)-dependent dehydrogenase (short-subunit alcohol dehydrogenase family)